MSKKVLVPIADGIEEMEAVILIDVLRRAGAAVTVASVDGLEVTASRRVKLGAEVLIRECSALVYDLIVLPGGLPGAEHLRDCPELIALLRQQRQAGRFFGAICASPAVVLQHHGLLDGYQATCYPGLISQLAPHDRIENRVVVDRNCVTSRGPGTAFEYALKLVELLYGPAKSAEIASQMLVI
jgi:4-methyl-5(b-hydroxyethyl)-thiazole monophosphate biosynthesis